MEVAKSRMDEARVKPNPGWLLFHAKRIKTDIGLVLNCRLNVRAWFREDGPTRFFAHRRRLGAVRARPDTDDRVNLSVKFVFEISVISKALFGWGQAYWEQKLRRLD